MIADDSLRKAGDLKPEHHLNVPQELEEEYSVEIFGLIVQLTLGGCGAITQFWKVKVGY